MSRVRCCRKDRQSEKFSVSRTMLQEKDRAKTKLINIKINQSIDADQGRVDFSPVNSLIDAGQNRVRIYSSYKI